MQFGIFTVGDVTSDPTTGRAPSEGRTHPGDRRHRQEGRRGRLGCLRDRRAPQSTIRALVADHAARLHRRADRAIILSTSTTLISTNDPVKIAEDFAVLQHLSGGQMTMLGQGNTGPVYPWFDRTFVRRSASTVDLGLLHRLWRDEVVDWEGQFRTPLQGFTLAPRPPRRCPAVRMARLHPHARDRRTRRLLRRRVLRQPHLLAAVTYAANGLAYRRRFAHYGHGTPAEAIVGLGGQVFMRKNSQDAVREFRPYFDNAGVRPRSIAGGVHCSDTADRRLARAGHRAHTGLSGLRRRLSAPAVSSSTTPDCHSRPCWNSWTFSGRSGAGAAPGVRRRETDGGRMHPHQSLLAAKRAAEAQPTPVHEPRGS